MSFPRLTTLLHFFDLHPEVKSIVSNDLIRPKREGGSGSLNFLPKAIYLAYQGRKKKSQHLKNNFPRETDMQLESHIVVINSWEIS